jgi:hypothetical protein
MTFCLDILSFVLHQQFAFLDFFTEEAKFNRSVEVFSAVPKQLERCFLLWFAERGSFFNFDSKKGRPAC